MPSTRIEVALSATPTASTDVIQQLSTRLGSQAPALVVAFASPRHALAPLQAALHARWPSAALLSCSTAGEFNAAQDTKGGVALWALCGDFVVRGGLGHGLKADPEKAVSGALADASAPVADHPHRVALMLLDPLSGTGEEATLLASALLGESVPLVGGAAGDDLAMSRTEVAHGTQVATDAVAAVVIHAREPVGVGVAHGHSGLSRELKVTRAEGATVMEVDGRPAWDAWKDHTRAAASARGMDVDTLPEDKVGAYLLTFEAGLDLPEGLKIRAPLSRTPSGGLNFACGIAEGSTIRITESVPQRQVESAVEAARRARAALNGRPVAGALVFDCICRNLILGTQFKDAVRGMSSALGTSALAGFETYGEIALAPGEFSGFHNTTSVVLAFPG